ncbi:MAG: hypothetical protein AMS14_07480 [Planctomycetes bacterium DG_20]|nr:MAG: hypothetical protein AMS14_07480 [Planctomycetes bacterium DG_20]
MSGKIAMGNRTPCGVLWVLLLAAGALAAAPGVPGRPREWALPVQEGSSLTGLRAVAEGRLVFLGETVFKKGPTGDDARPRFILHMLDTKTGRFSDEAKPFARAMAGQKIGYHFAVPSPDGQYIVFGVSTQPGPGTRTAYLLDRGSGTTRKLAERLADKPVWAGRKLYIGCLTPDRRLGPIQVFDSAKGTLAPMKLCGLVGAADATGQFLVCAHDPKDPTTPLGRREFRQKAVTAVISPDGKLVRERATAEPTHTPPVFSPSGKYLAALHLDFADLRPPGVGPKPPPKSYLEIVEIGGEGRWRIKGEAWPKAVSDTGEVVAAHKDEKPGQEEIKIWDAKGNSRTLARGARYSTVAGGTLYYVTGRPKPVLKAVQLEAAK